MVKDEHERTSAEQNATAVLAIGAGIAGLTLAAVIARGATRRLPAHVAALQSYLLDHLAASDAALGLVTRLRDQHAGTIVGALARRLHGEFRQERHVVIAVLHGLGVSPRSVKRGVGKMAGGAALAFGPALSGQYPVFLALETLTAGVQAKRLMWRALRGLPLEGQWPFDALEQQALGQWEDLEAMRQAFSHAVFESRDTRPAPVVPPL